MNRTEPFGLLAFLHWNHPWNNFSFDEKTLARAIQQLGELGIPMIRMDILWADVEQELGRFDFKKYDRIISLLQAEKIQILALLHYNRFEADLNDNKSWNHPPESLSQFVNYVSQTVSRYSSTIKHWEIWNEPNHQLYWNQPKDGMKRYAELLSASYQMIKKIDPGATVLNGGLANPIAEDLMNLYEQGGKNFTDIINIHPFTDPLAPDALTKLDEIVSSTKRVMSGFGDHSKKIWITEMGCPGIPDNLPEKKWFSGGHVDEKVQAEWLKTLYAHLPHMKGVEKLFWAFYRDTLNEFKDGTDFLGIVRNDLTPKPAFRVFKDLIQEYRKGSKLKPR